uniref:RNA-directed DNA polymerase from mobile element jockey n=1 Tax=Ascaris lumbricoides TaxID=6252 RepID=A0A0M3IQN2_ASCLU
ANVVREPDISDERLRASCLRENKSRIFTSWDKSLNILRTVYTIQHDFCLDLFAPLPPPPIAIDRLNKLVDEKLMSHNGCRSDHIFHSR